MNNYLTNYEKKCKDSVGKLRRLYIMPYEYHDELEIEVRDGVLFLFPLTTIFQFDVEGSYTQSATIEKGLQQWNQDVSFQLTKMYGELNPEIFTNNKFRAIAETYNDDFIFFGLNGGLESELTNGSGDTKSDFNGLSVTLKGIEEQAGVITNMSQFYKFVDNESFNYNFNFNL